MVEERISSRRNPLVQRLRALHQASGRQERQSLLLEGTHLVEEALRLGHVPDLLLSTPAWALRHAHLLGGLPPATSRREATQEVLEAVATTRSPDGVVATLPWTLPSPPLPAKAGAFTLLLDNVQDPGNLGTLLRTAWAAGVDQVWLREGADPWQPKVLRASSGASLALVVGRLSHGALLERLRLARQGGALLVATVVRGGEPYWRHDWRRPTVVMLGNEGAGLSQELVEWADRRLSLPHSPAVESLNVAIAAAPLLLERQRQQLGAGAGDLGAGTRENGGINQQGPR